MYEIRFKAECLRFKKEWSEVSVQSSGPSILPPGAMTGELEEGKESPLENERENGAVRGEQISMSKKKRMFADEAENMFADD